jgi:hypothetical protein
MVGSPYHRDCIGQGDESLFTNGRGIMRKIWTLLAISCGLLFAAPALSATAEATHEQTKTVKVQGTSGTSLQTLATTPDGKVVALVSLPRYGAAPSGSPVAEVHVFDGEGKALKKWSLEFIAQSIGTGPDGAIYVAGDGQVARYSADGKLLANAEVPHLAEVLKDQAKLREQAEAQIKAQQASMEEAKKSFLDQAKALRDKGDKLTPQEKQQLEALEVNLKLYDQLGARQQQSIEAAAASLTARLRIINSVSATEKDVFVACGELKGYGYAVWRMDLEFKNPKQVLSKLGGCCGQMDVQAHGDRLFVAENTRHRVGQFDLEGKSLVTFGKRERVSEGDCFAGCCNPMNCRIAANGDVYTAESEGIIKKFNAQGEFVALVGSAKLTGGCKNVAVAASPSGDKVYFCDQPGSQIIVLTQKTANVTTAAEEKPATR